MLPPSAVLLELAALTELELVDALLEELEVVVDGVLLADALVVVAGVVADALVLLVEDELDDDVETVAPVDDAASALPATPAISPTVTALAATAVTAATACVRRRKRWDVVMAHTMPSGPSGRRHCNLKPWSCAQGRTRSGLPAN